MENPVMVELEGERETNLLRYVKSLQ